MTPLLPLFLLAVGTLAVLVGFIPNFRLTGLIAVGVVLVAFVAQVFLGLQLPVTVTISTWEPVALFPRPLQLTADGLSWSIGVVLLLVTLALFATSLGDEGQPRVAARLLSLLVTGAALTAIFADNLIAIAISWTALDALYGLSLAVLGGRDQIDDTTQITLGLNVVSSVLVVAAALAAINDGRAGLLSDDSLPPLAVLLVVAAGVLRLGVFPFHAALPDKLRLGLAVGALLRLAPAAVAFELLARVALLPGAETLPYAGVLTVLGVIGVVYGGVQWWIAPYPPAGLPFVVLGQSSLALLTVLWGGALAGVGLAGLGMALLVGAGVLFLSNQAQVGAWRIPVVLGVVVLLGAPFTVGFVGLSVLYAGLIAAGWTGWLTLSFVVLGQALMMAAALRLAFFDSFEETLPPEAWVKVGYLFGLGLLITPGVLLGVLPPITARLIAGAVVELPALNWVVIVLVVGPMVIGGVLWYFEWLVRAAADRLWDALNDVSRLDWLYRTLIDGYQLVGRVVGVVAGVIEGEGGVLWTLVAALLVWLLVTGG